MKISTFTFKGRDIDMMYNKGALAYSFTQDGNTYGISVKLQSKSVLSIASAVFQLITNAIETIDQLNGNK